MYKEQALFDFLPFSSFPSIHYYQTPPRLLRSRSFRLVLTISQPYTIECYTKLVFRLALISSNPTYLAIDTQLV